MKQLPPLPPPVQPHMKPLPPPETPPLKATTPKPAKTPHITPYHHRTPHFNHYHPRKSPLLKPPGLKPPAPFKVTSSIILKTPELLANKPVAQLENPESFFHSGASILPG
ncbi:extensin-like [Penaeus monodon]|uniref:extensin-like n=1 Tax=Penaeus monodon TaxID=6687 RepID=UPI0018A7670C|nr:extensin-like [Penaeus monodon]